MKKKILVRAPALSQTGYGEQCRFALRALRSREDLFDIYLMNIPWGGSNWIFEDNNERKWIDSLISKAQPLLAQQQANPKVALFDISLQVTIPNELQKMASQNILYTAGIETDKACAAWVGKCHEFADKILVISEHAKAGLQVPVRAKDQTGNEFLFTLEKPIEVVHYPVKKVEAVNLPLDLETDFNFLAMSQFGPRKNFKNTITWFVEEFHDDPNVGLVVKLFGKGNSKIDREWSENQLKAFLENTPDRKCKIYLLHGYLNEKELHSLYVHPKIKALINFGHGEGFGLPLFEAAYSGLPVITHDFGGQKDFLYAPKKDKKTKKKKMRAHFSKILYDLKPVQQEAVWQGVIEPDMNWAWPNPTSCKLAMREAVKNYGMLQGEAKRLKEWLEEEFEEDKKYESFVNKLLGIVKIEPKPINGISFCIPTNGKRVEKTLLTIESIKRQQGVPTEIILCGDVDPFKEVQDVILVDRKEEAHNRKVALLRNKAAEKAKHDVIAWCDDDILLDEGWLEKTLKHTEKEGWEILGNKLLNPDGTRCWDRATVNPHKLVDYDEPAGTPNLYQTSGFFLVRKEVWDRVKWNEELLVHDDKNGQIPEDIGYSLSLIKNSFSFHFNKTAIVWHNDNSYTEWTEKTLLKEKIVEETGFNAFLENDKKFLQCLGKIGEKK